MGSQHIHTSWRKIVKVIDRQIAELVRGSRFKFPYKYRKGKLLPRYTERGLLALKKYPIESPTAFALAFNMYTQIDHYTRWPLQFNLAKITEHQLLALSILFKAAAPNSLLRRQYADLVEEIELFRTAAILMLEKDIYADDSFTGTS
jgi:hypothetical protein